ncbi:MAG: hypothetical protein ACRDRK_26630 [Pseudonocardia sp.]
MSGICGTLPGMMIGGHQLRFAADRFAARVRCVMVSVSMREARE